MGIIFIFMLALLIIAFSGSNEYGKRTGTGHKNSRSRVDQSLMEQQMLNDELLHHHDMQEHLHHHQEALNHSLHHQHIHDEMHHNHIDHDNMMHNHMNDMGCDHSGHMNDMNNNM